MKIYEKPHDIIYPQHCLFLIDIPVDSLAMCLNEIENNPPGGFMSMMQDHDYEAFSDYPGNDIDDLIITAATDASSSGLIPACFNHERKLFMQDFKSNPVSIALSDIKDSIGDNSYDIYAQDTMKRFIVIPQWNNINVFISIINAPFCAHGPAQYCYYRIHNISER